MAAEHKYLLPYFVDDEEFVRCLAVLQNVRNYVVPIYVSRQIENSLEYLSQYRPDLGLFAVFKHSLDDSAAELMDRHLEDFSPECIHNKLDLLRLNLLNYLLHYMIPISILYARKDLRLDLLD